MDDDGRQKPERAEADRGEERKRALDADLRQLVGRQRAQVPDETEDGVRSSSGSNASRRLGVRPARTTMASSMA